jgi:hypothetical protein
MGTLGWVISREISGNQPNPLQTGRRCDILNKIKLAAVRGSFLDQIIPSPIATIPLTTTQSFSTNALPVKTGDVYDLAKQPLLLNGRKMSV